MQLQLNGKPFQLGQLRPPLIVRAGWQYKVIFPEVLGQYDENKTFILPKTSPWHSISKRCLDRGGSFVEMVEDDEFAEQLLSHGTYRSPSDIGWFDAGDELRCMFNAERGADFLPKARIFIGLGLHYSFAGTDGVFWCRHTWLSVPRRDNSRKDGPIWEVTALPFGYFGWRASNYWWKRWAGIAGVQVGEEVNMNGR